MPLRKGARSGKLAGHLAISQPCVSPLPSESIESNETDKMKQKRMTVRESGVKRKANVRRMHTNKPEKHQKVGKHDMRGHSRRVRRVSGDFSDHALEEDASEGQGMIGSENSDNTEDTAEPVQRHRGQKNLSARELTRGGETPVESRHRRSRNQIVDDIVDDDPVWFENEPANEREESLNVTNRIDNEGEERVAIQRRAKERRVAESEEHETRGGLVSNEVAVLRRMFVEEFNTLKKQEAVREERIMKLLRESNKKHDDVLNTVIPIVHILSAQKSTKQRSNRECVMQGRVMVLDSLLNPEVLQNLMEQCVLGFFTNHVENRDCSEFAETASKCLRAIMFSRLPWEPLEKFETPIGEVHSSFRMGVLLSTLRALQMDTLSMFAKPTNSEVVVGVSDALQSPPASQEESNRIGSIAAGSVVTESRLVQPPWLRPGYITKQHCKKVKLMKERRGSGDKPNKKVSEKMQANPDFISNDDMAVHAVTKMYSLLTSQLHKCRDALKITFFDEVGYVFTNWSNLDSAVDQSTLRIWWDSTEQKNIRFDEIPTSKICSYAERKKQICEDDDSRVVNMFNQNCFQKSIDADLSFRLWVEHTVQIRDDNDNHSRRIRRMIDLPVVACNMISSYTAAGLKKVPRYLLVVS